MESSRSTPGPSLLLHQVPAPCCCGSWCARVCFLLRRFGKPEWCVSRHRVVRAQCTGRTSCAKPRIHSASTNASKALPLASHYSVKMMLASMRQQARASTGWCWPMHCAPSARRTLTTPRHNATKLHASRPCRAAAQRSARRSHSAVVPQAYLHSDPSADSSGASGSLPGQLKVLVVGANAAGLAAAVALAQQARCAVEVHDSRPDPRDDQNAHDSSSSSTLVALGESGMVHSGAQGVSHAAAGQASAMVTLSGIRLQF